MSTARPPEIPAVANQQVLVELLHALPRPWSAATFSPSEVLAIAYAPCTQWSPALDLKVERLLQTNAGVQPPRGGRSFPRIAEWSPDDPRDSVPPANRPEGAQRRHCLTLVLSSFEDREDAERWPGYIRALVDECSMPVEEKGLEGAVDPGRPNAASSDDGDPAASWKHASQLNFLERIEEDVFYVLECLVQELTGEAKRELDELIGMVEAAKGLEPSGRNELLDPMRESLRRLRSDSYDATARAGLVALRRRIHETRRALQGKPASYTATPPLELWATEA